MVYSTADDGAATQRVLTNGTLAGLHALVKSFTITSDATSTVDRANVQLTQSFETALVPIFQFAVFYGNDLEIAPGPAMTLIGRVHSNGNLWVQAGATLKMDSYVTASGNIIHGRKGPGGVDNGDVHDQRHRRQLRVDERRRRMARLPGRNWYDSSLARWKGRVQDSTHGQGELNLPSDQRRRIRTRSSSARTTTRIRTKTWRPSRSSTTAA